VGKWVRIFLACVVEAFNGWMDIMVRKGIVVKQLGLASREEIKGRHLFCSLRL